MATAGSISKGYLSEVEIGQKEPSSEVVTAIARALNLPVSVLLYRVADALFLEEHPELEGATDEVGSESRC